MKQENRIRDAFDCIGASEELKSSTKEFLRDARQREAGHSIGRQRNRHAFRLAAGIACAMATLFLCIGSYALLWMPVAYVSIDVNPSLELELNRLDRVISGRAYNEDGERILEGVSVKGMRYEAAIESILGSEGMRPYLTQDGALTFTVATDSLPKEERLLADISRSTGCVEHGGTSVRADMSLVEEAHENGLSLGKYLAYKVLLRYEPDLTVQDCHEMGMSQIHGRIEEHEHGANHGSGHGAGHEDDYGTESGAGYETENDVGTGSETEDGMTDEDNRFIEQSGELPMESPAPQPDGQEQGHHEGNGHGQKSGHGH